jgi:hypothetical protein
MLNRHSSENELIDAAITLHEHQAIREGAQSMQPARHLCEVDGDFVLLSFRDGPIIVYKIMDVRNRAKLKLVEPGDPEWAELVEYGEEEITDTWG